MRCGELGRTLRSQRPRIWLTKLMMALQVSILRSRYKALKVLEKQQKAIFECIFMTGFLPSIV